jgi:DNA replication protein DnaC
VNDRADAIRIPKAVALAIAAPSFDPSRPAVRAAAAFLDGADPRFLLALAGPPGTGKSAAAARAILDARKPDRTVSVLLDGVSTPHTFSGEPIAARWAQAGDLWSKVYSSEVWHELRRVPALVLDDLGAEPPKDERAAAMFAALLCERVDDARKTLVTTNLDDKAFLARYGPRVIDRMHEGWIGVTGASLRGARRGP